MNGNIFLNENVIDNNFFYKKNLGFSVDQAIDGKLKRIIARKPSSVTVHQEALEWLRDIQARSEKCLRNYLDSTYSRVKYNDELLRLLHEVEWVYIGALMTERNNLTYPEATFRISVNNFNGMPYYFVSYGLDPQSSAYQDTMSTPRHAYGSYTYVKTLTEALDFVFDEYKFFGKEALCYNIAESRLDEYMAKSGKKLARENRNQAITSLITDKISPSINRRINDTTRWRAQHSLMRSTDISSVPAFISYRLIPRLEERLEKVRDIQRKKNSSNMTANIQRRSIDIDATASSHNAPQHPAAADEVPSSEDIINSIRYDKSYGDTSAPKNAGAGARSDWSASEEPQAAAPQGNTRDKQHRTTIQPVEAGLGTSLSLDSFINDVIGIDDADKDESTPVISGIDAPVTAADEDNIADIGNTEDTEDAKDTEDADNSDDGNDTGGYDGTSPLDEELSRFMDSLVSPSEDALPVQRGQ